jgi:hypothetical protein
VIFEEGAFDGDVGQPKLALGSVAHRVDYDDPCGGCSDNGIRWDEDTSPIGNAKPPSVEPDSYSDLCNRIDWTAVGHAARNRCGIWAAAYLWLGAVDSPTDALIYSIDSMATLGASGLTLQRPWQVMGGLEAVNGMILFGVSTAYVVLVNAR